MYCVTNNCPKIRERCEALDPQTLSIIAITLLVVSILASYAHFTKISISFALLALPVVVVDVVLMCKKKGSILQVNDNYIKTVSK